MRINIVFFLCILLSSFNVKAINVSDVDFVSFLQSEIENCVRNLKAITDQPQKNNLFLNECTRIVANSNRLGKIEFLYERSQENSLKREIEDCSEFLRPRDFIECVYE